METVLINPTHFTYFYVGLFLILGSFGLPFPEEIVLLSAGYLAGVGFVHLWFILPFTMAVVIIGDSITYSFSRHYGRNAIVKWGKYIFLPIHRLERLEYYYDRHGNKTVFFSRLLIGFRFLGIIVAGLSKMPWKKFLTYDTLSIFLYLPLMLGIGYLFHFHLAMLLQKFAFMRHVIFGLVLTLMFALFIRMLMENIGTIRKNDQ